MIGQIMEVKDETEEDYGETNYVVKSCPSKCLAVSDVAKVETYYGLSTRQNYYRLESKTLKKALKEALLLLDAYIEEVEDE
jgi:hypothetical protein